MLHVGPEADLSGELLPHALVLPDGLLALLDKGLQTIVHDLFLLVLLADADLFLDFQLHRKTVGVPAGLSGDLLALHRMVAGDHVLDDTRLDVPDVRLSVGGRRTIVEHVDRMTLILLYALLEDSVLLPELCHLVLTLDKVQIGFYLVVHLTSSCGPFSSARTLHKYL